MSANEPITIKWTRGQKTFPPGTTITIGRDVGCDVVLDNPNVSRQHARVHDVDGTWTVVDAGSAQGLQHAGSAATQVAVSQPVELVLGRPGVGERIELIPETRSSLDAAATVLPEADAPAAATVLPQDGPQRPGGNLRAEALTSATVVTGSTLNVECAGRSYSFEPGREIIIGRDPDSDIPTANPTVSRRHASLRHDGSQWVLDDLGSSGGTFVDGRKIHSLPLAGSVAAWLGDADTGERLVLVAPGQRSRSAGAKLERAARRGPGLLIVGAVAALAIVIAAAALLLGGGGGGGAPDNDELLRGTVALLVDDGSGSGSIIDADKGLILTNAHVVAPRAPGFAVNTGLPSTFEAEDPEIIDIAITTSPDEPAEIRFRGVVVAADGYLDLAVVQITHTASGGIVDADDLDGQLVELEIGDSEDVRSGDDVRAVGFPGNAMSGAATIRSGIVSGSQQDDRLVTNRGLFNLDMTISGGNSGGALVDEDGKLIGVPSSVDAETGQVGHARPIHLAEKLLDAVEEGTEYESAYLEPVTGEERIAPSGGGWSTPGDLEGFRHGGCDALTSAPAEGDPILAFSFDYEGFPDDHQDVLLVVFDAQGDVVSIASTADRYPFEWSGSGCATVTMLVDEPLAAGRYTMKWYVGPSYVQIAVPERAAGFRIGGGGIAGI